MGYDCDPVVLWDLKNDDWLFDVVCISVVDELTEDDVEEEDCAEGSKNKPMEFVLGITGLHDGQHSSDALVLEESNSNHCDVFFLVEGDPVATCLTAVLLNENDAEGTDDDDHK